MALKTYYYKMLDNENYVLAYGKGTSSKAPTSTPTRIIMLKAEYDTLVAVWKNRPNPSDDAHEVRLKDNLDGTYNYVEVLKPIEEIVED